MEDASQNNALKLSVEQKLDVVPNTSTDTNACMRSLQRAQTQAQYANSAISNATTGLNN